MRSLSRLLSHAGLVTLVLTGTCIEGCTFALSTDTVQCSTRDDCVGRGSRFEGMTCGDKHVCIPIEGYCFTNAECIDRVGAETYICKKSSTPGENRCVNLLGAGCDQIFSEKGDLRNDDAVIVALTMMSRWSSGLASGVPGADLARKDWLAQNNGLRPRPGGETKGCSST